ncbi:MAG TPA: hypothetical protein VE591_07400 [Candidatus Acidoferrum sp.]|nr:hypothetical protein [Candidatus Acidoferrum sp.]
MENLIRSGVPFELAGLVYFVFYLRMSRGSSAAQFSRRSKILTLLAAMVLIGSVVLHYADRVAGIVLMLAFAVASLISTWADRLR